MFFKKDSFLSTEQKARIVNAIREAELQTSGEIRVHIEPNCVAKEPIHRAVEIFNKQKTAYEIASGDWSSDVCSSDLNTSIQTFPNVITARMFGFQPKGYFKAEAGAEKATKIKL